MFRMSYYYVDIRKIIELVHRYIEPFVGYF